MMGMKDIILLYLIDSTNFFSRNFRTFCPGTKARTKGTKGLRKKPSVRVRKPPLGTMTGTNVRPYRTASGACPS
jgi:hypothetical protein